MQLRHLRRLAVGATTILGLVATLTLTGSSASAAQPWRALDTEYGSGFGLLACVEKAEQERPHSWFCNGGQLTVATPNDQGKTVPKTTMVKADYRDTSKDGASVQQDDYDYWCELASICGRQINDYTAEVKGNGAYGDEDGVIGALDLVYRQSFDGGWPRWRSLIIWEYGPEIQPFEFRNDCRTQIDFWPDGYCGQNSVYFGNVDSTDRRSWFPGQSSYYYNEDQLTDGDNHHDDLYGNFYATGHDQLFFAGVIHTGRWDRCDDH